MANLARLVDLQTLRSAGLSVVADVMHGTGAGYFVKALGGGATRVVQLRGERNPIFPGMHNPEPIARNLQPLIQRVAEEKAHVGLAVDGDADRLGVIDERGNFITTLQAFALLCLYYLDARRERGPLVRSVTQTSMIDILGEKYGVPVFVTPVGFKYLGPVMMREKAMLAGEESGGYAFRGNIPERDGLLSGLIFLEMMVKSGGRKPSELLEYLFSKAGPHYYHRWDIDFDPRQRRMVQSRMKKARPQRLADGRVLDIDTQDGYRSLLDGGAWSLVRLSGTEPLVRVYAEAETPDRVEKLLEETRSLAGV
jgi:phosphomannomutase